MAGAARSGRSSGGHFSASVDAFGHVVLGGELIDGTFDALRAALDLALLEPGELILIDFQRVSSLGSAALTELLHYQLVAARQQRRFCLVNVSSGIRKALSHLDLEGLLLSRHESDVSILEPTDCECP